MNTFQVSLEILHGAFDEVCNLQRLNLKLKKFIKKKGKKGKKKSSLQYSLLCARSFYGISNVVGVILSTGGVIIQGDVNS